MNARAMRYGGLLIGFAIVCASFAQPQWSAPLLPVQKDGYYTLVLSPEVIGRSRADLRDLRVLDSLHHEVPYVIEQESALTNTIELRSFKLLRNERLGKRTIIEIEGDTSALVDELRLCVRNADALKSARVSGSDDPTTWYIVTEETLALGSNLSEDPKAYGFHAISLDIPPSNYRQYRIELNDSLTGPIQVLDIGHLGRARGEGRYTPIDGLKFSRVEDKTTTRIMLVAESPFKADRVAFDIRSDAPYLRSGTFSHREPIAVQGRLKMAHIPMEAPMGNFTLASSGRGVITGPATITDTLLISIDNLNDRPLEITAIRAFQLEHRLIAKLNAGSNYTISTGDEKANAPSYDLDHFRDSIPASISVLHVPPMIPSVKVTEVGPSFAPNMKWVWAFIIGLGALMAVVAVRMMRRASHEETLDNNSPN